MAIATIVAATLQGFVNPLANAIQPPPEPQPRGIKYHYESLRRNRFPTFDGNPDPEDETLKMHRFKKGLNSRIQSALAVFKPNNFSDLMGAAMSAETDIKRRDDENKNKRPMSSQSTQNSPKFKKPNYSGGSFKGNSGSAGNTEGKWCDTCRQKHVGECYRKMGACFKCGKVGHRIKDCPDHKDKGTGSNKKNENKTNARLETVETALFGFVGHVVYPEGEIIIPLTLGSRDLRKTVITTFIVDSPSSYDIILGWLAMNELRAVASTYHQKIKFLVGARVGEVRGDQPSSRKCYVEAVRADQSKTRREGKKTRIDEVGGKVVEKGEVHFVAEEEQEVVEAGPGQKIPVAQDLRTSTRVSLINYLKTNIHVFAWSQQELTGISPLISKHQLNILPGSHSVKQKKRHFGPEKGKVIDKHVRDLLKAGHIQEIQFPTRLSNMVLVPKSTGKWRMCVDFRDLNKACPKDHYPLTQIDKLVDSTSGYELLSFMDAYQGYNQIPLAKNDQDKASFITLGGTFCYVVMSFGLKNAGATYQRLMNKVFEKQLGRNVEVYVDDILGKSKEVAAFITDLEETFATLMHYGIKLNPAKCIFGGKSGKFLGFIVTDRGIEVLRQAQQFGWNEKCEQAFQDLKIHLAELPIKGVYEAKDDRMLKYLQLIKAQSEVFMDWSIEQIPREENNKADALAKMAASLLEASTREVLHIFRLVLSSKEEILPAPEYSWMTPLIKFIINNELPKDKARAQKIKRKALRFVLLNNVLYRRLFQGPLLKCLSTMEVDYVLREIHEGCCGEHLGGISLAQKTMLVDFGGQILAKTLLKWSGLWGMDIVGPLPIARAQKKFLLVAVDYFSKWVEAEHLAKITEQELLKFLWKNIVCRFGVPMRLISDNERQFQGREITSWCWEMKITQFFTSVDYPQANGQTEVNYPRAPTQETPFNLVYGSEAVMPVEIRKTSSRVESYPDNNDQSRAMELELVEEKRDRALIRMEAFRGRVMKSYNKKVRIRDFQVGDLVMKKVNPARDVGKLEARWEGSYKITRRVSSGSFYLEDAERQALKRP
ncbi:uncharacterized protein LOC142550056 [Primulina tabacum]|uniref:uncharacterized protein LOC142550056 n=1 Tax=Primulina tabacum TaxID=48773 RepID=UPI003F59DF28